MSSSGGLPKVKSQPGREESGEIVGSNPLALTQLSQTNLWNPQPNLIQFYIPQSLSALTEDLSPPSPPEPLLLSYLLNSHYSPKFLSKFSKITDKLVSLSNFGT